MVPWWEKEREREWGVKEKKIKGGGGMVWYERMKKKKIDWRPINNVVSLSIVLNLFGIFHEHNDFPRTNTNELKDIRCFCCEKLVTTKRHADCIERDRKLGTKRKQMFYYLEDDELIRSSRAIPFAAAALHFLRWRWRSLRAELGVCVCVCARVCRLGENVQKKKHQPNPIFISISLCVTHCLHPSHSITKWK